MGWQRKRIEAPREPGNWRQFRGMTKVMGMAHRAGAAGQWVRHLFWQNEFVSHVAELEREPSNPRDPNAIKVIGLIGRKRVHVGYLPSELSEDVNRMGNVPIAIQTYKVGREAKPLFTPDRHFAEALLLVPIKKDKVWSNPDAFRPD